MNTKRSRIEWVKMFFKEGFNFKNGFRLINVFVILICIVVGSLILKGTFPYLTADSSLITISKAERVVDKDAGSARYLVWSDKGTFEITDTLAYFQFRSSDLYGQLKPGMTVEVKYYGWRNGLLSMYPNIYSIRKQ